MLHFVIQGLQMKRNSSFLVTCVTRLRCKALFTNIDHQIELNLNGRVLDAIALSRYAAMETGNPQPLAG